MTVTRRLAAIMAVDVVGYSRLMGEDEAGTVRAGARTSRGARCYRHARSEMPRQDSQVTVDGHLRVAAGVGLARGRRPLMSPPHSLEWTSAGTLGSVGLDRCVSLLSMSGLDESD